MGEALEKWHEIPINKSRPLYEKMSSGLFPGQIESFNLKEFLASITIDPFTRTAYKKHSIINYRAILARIKFTFDPSK